MMPGAIGLELRRPADHLPVAAVVDRKQRPGPVLQEPTGDPERRRARARPKLQHPAGLVHLDQRVEKEAEILGAVARPDVLRVAIEILDAGEAPGGALRRGAAPNAGGVHPRRSEEHTSELQSLMRTSYAVFCLKKKIKSLIPT